MSVMKRGERISRGARLRLSCAAAVLDGGRVLLTRRTDNGRWCLPAGGLEPGESAAESCEREVFEETGLVVRATHLVGVYSSPHRVFEYPDGNRWHVVELLFAAEAVGGVISATAEASVCGFFSAPEMAAMDIMEHDLERIPDLFTGKASAIIR